MFFFLARGPSFTLGAALTCFPPEGSSGLCSLTDIAKKNPEKSIRLASPQRGAAAALRRELAGGGKRAVGS